jgi:mitogen-activated protein kinase 1/3
LPIRKKRSFPTLFPHASKEALDFLSKTLVRNPRAFISNQSKFFLIQTFDPKKRLTVDEALEHPYLSAYVNFLLAPTSDKY